MINYNYFTSESVYHLLTVPMVKAFPELEGSLLCFANIFENYSPVKISRLFKTQDTEVISLIARECNVKKLTLEGPSIWGDSLLVRFEEGVFYAFLSEDDYVDLYHKHVKFIEDTNFLFAKIKELYKEALMNGLTPQREDKLEALLSSLDQDDIPWTTHSSLIWGEKNF